GRAAPRRPVETGKGSSRGTRRRCRAASGGARATATRRAGGPRRGAGAEGGTTPPVRSRARRREGDGDTAVRAPKKRRRGRRLPPVPPVPMSGEPVSAGARRPPARLPGVFAAVAVVLAGTFVWQSLTRDDQERRPTAETRRPAVPASWRSFQDPDGTYRL